MDIVTARRFEWVCETGLPLISPSSGIKLESYIGISRQASTSELILSTYLDISQTGQYRLPNNGRQAGMMAT